MNSKLLNYIKYGAYNNTICFPEANADPVKIYQRFKRLTLHH